MPSPTCRRQSTLNPSESKVTVLRALILSDKGEQAPARADIDKVIAAEPKNASAHYARALISFREHDLDAAAADADKAVALKDAFPAAHTLLGRIAEDRKDNDAAGRTTSARSLFPPNPSTHAHAHDEAREHLDALGGETHREGRRVGRSSGGARDRMPPVHSRRLDHGCRRLPR